MINRLVICNTLKTANRALTKPVTKNINALLDCSQKIQGKSSASWKALGIALMIFGAGLAVIGGCVTAVGIATIPTGFGISMIATGVGLSVGGVAIFSTGFGFFAHGRQKGTSKAISDFAEESYKLCK